MGAFLSYQQQRGPWSRSKWAQVLLFLVTLLKKPAAFIQGTEAGDTRGRSGCWGPRTLAPFPPPGPGRGAAPHLSCIPAAQWTSMSPLWLLPGRDATLSTLSFCPPYHPRPRFLSPITALPSTKYFSSRPLTWACPGESRPFKWPR